MTSITATRNRYSTEMAGDLLDVDGVDRDAHGTPEHTVTVPVAASDGPVDRPILQMPADDAGVRTPRAAIRRTLRFGRRSARRNGGSLQKRIDFCLAGTEETWAPGSTRAPEAGQELADSGMVRIPA